MAPCAVPMPLSSIISPARPPPSLSAMLAVVTEDHEEFRRTLELLGDLLEEERGERHVPALPPNR